MSNNLPASALPPLPEYLCPRVPEPPPVDGSLVHPAWAAAPAVLLGNCLTGAPPRQRTAWRLVWHGDYLYVGVQVTEADLQDHNSRRDDPVYSEQCVEVFLQSPAGLPATAADPHCYLEADVSPTGVLFDARIANAPGAPLTVDTAFNPEDLLVAGALRGTVNDPSDRDEGWTLTMRLPFTAPPGGRTPEPGEVWRCNLYRVSNWQQPDQELQSWSVVGVGNFHVPERFGHLRFTG